MKKQSKFSAISITVSALLALSVCTNAQAADTPVSTKQVQQATSLLGQPLFSAVPEKLSSDSDSKVVRQLVEARKKYEASPDDADNIIWYGRRMAYTGDFIAAIDIFSEGIEKHPEDARFYRHRGHRYITIREFDKAIADLEKAAALIEGTENRIEPDGMPNKHNIPVSTMHGNIWYHLGLAYYLKHDWDNALSAYQNAFNAGEMDDNKVSTTHWIYMILRRMGREEDARAALAPINKDMNILENDYYHRLCLFYKGEISESEMFANSSDSVQTSGASYGRANWYLYNGDKQKAVKLMQQFVDTSKIWGAFGYIAAEADLAAFKKSSK